MSLILLSSAWAEDLTWTCPPLTQPSDGLVFLEPETLGTREFAEQVEADARTWFDASCPADGLDGSALCFTAAGDAIALAADARGVDLSLVPASGSLTRLQASWSHPIDGVGEYEYDELGVRVTWAGVLDAAWPADRTIGANAAELSNPDTPSTMRSAAWDDGTCAWSVTRTVTGEEPDVTAVWEISVDGHTLVVTEWPDDGCHPGAQAVFDGVVYPVEVGTWLPSGADGDGDGWTVEDGDCDDTDPSTFPCADDSLCDGIDADCDGFGATDADGDGYLDCEDCDDQDPSANPEGVDEDCDGVDQDCNRLDGPDDDGDGYSVCDDCDDADTTVNPGWAELDCDGVDRNCDGLDGKDADGDGFSACEDCDDTSAGTHPAAVDDSCDGVDQDCDLVDGVDRDGDGWADCEDCDDADAATYPGAADEPGDRIDQDCDGFAGSISGDGCGCAAASRDRGFGWLIAILALGLGHRRRKWTR